MSVHFHAEGQRREGLRLFVWRDVLWNDQPGAMAALAADADEARALIRAACPHVPDEDLASEPQSFEGPAALVVWGSS